MADCKICAKGSQCQGCKDFMIHSTLCSKACKCDVYIQCKASCQCVAKQYCARCSLEKKKCIDCEELLSKCESRNTYNFFSFISKQ